MANAISGIQPYTGIGIIKDDAAFATPEERYGGTADPFHGHTGEQDKPYSWQSLQMPAASHGPYGPQNQLLDDEYWFLEPAGYPEQDPDFDRNMPSLTRSHGSVHNVTISGPLPSQYDAINRQLSQMGNKASDLNTSNSMMYNSLGYVQNDNWNEIWVVDDGSSDLPEVGKQFSHQANGFGVNDAASNASRKTNFLGGWGDKHFHRRYANGHIPGNYMWMRPNGRPLFKTIAGTAKLPIGPDSQFTGVDDPNGNPKDIGFPFDPYGAVLQSTPTEYVPPPAPNVAPVTPAYSNDYGTDGVDLW